MSVRNTKTLHKELPRIVIKEMVIRALEEDLAAGDVTTEACIDDNSNSVANAVARHDLIACGSNVAACVFEMVDPDLKFEELIADGTSVQKGQILWRVTGKTRSILMGERVALNFVQRLSGIATMTHTYVKAIPPGFHTRISDTRKTTPGLRAFERYAVRMGGGFNHRDNLSSAVLIKDNHIAACGGVTTAIKRAKTYASHTCRIECEVETLEQLKEALDVGVDVVLLDNMPPLSIVEAVKLAKGRAIIEASGGITLTHIEELARAGVDVISTGAITHSAPAADIGLDM